MQKTVLRERETVTRKKMAGLIKWKVIFSFLATTCENGIDMGVTQEEEKIGPKLYETCTEICTFIR